MSSMLTTDPDDIVDLWLAAMKAAAMGSTTQIKMTIDHPVTRKPTLVRVIVVPEAIGSLGEKKTKDSDIN